LTAVDEAVDKAVAALARRQQGFVTRAQLLALGVGDGAIKYRLRIGRLLQAYAGVYAVGHIPALPIPRAAAAVLACGPRAALSHTSAMTLWGWRKRWESPYHVTAPTGHRRKGIHLHRSAAVGPGDITKHLGIRVTTPARTILDSSSLLSDKALRRAVSDARLSRHLWLAELAKVLERFPRHPGASRLIPFVAAPSTPTRSDFEDAFKALCERFGLPRPQTNVHVCGYQVDALFEAERLIVELDGYQTHGDRGAFETDRNRDADTLAGGFGTVRVTWERMRAHPRKEAVRLQTILRLRRG
jgi:very-short-patch-repair endonuclease